MCICAPISSYMNLHAPTISKLIMRPYVFFVRRPMKANQCSHGHGYAINSKGTLFGPALHVPAFNFVLSHAYTTIPRPHPSCFCTFSAHEKRLHTSHIFVLWVSWFSRSLFSRLLGRFGSFGSSVAMGTSSTKEKKKGTFFFVMHTIARSLGSLDRLALGSHVCQGSGKAGAHNGLNRA